MDVALHGLGGADSLTMCHILCHILTMPSVNLRQLRDSRQLLTWLEAGEVVELRKRNCVVARIVPESPRPKPVVWPDFASRLKRNFGDRILPGADLLIDERKKSRY